jgi:hypothetical protein
MNLLICQVVVAIEHDLTNADKAQHRIPVHLPFDCFEDDARFRCAKLVIRQVVQHVAVNRVLRHRPRNCCQWTQLMTPFQLLDISFYFYI